MKRQYTELTGSEIVRGIRSTNQRKRLLAFAGLLLCIAGMFGAFVWIIRMHEYFYGGILVLMCAAIIWALMNRVTKINKVLANVENCPLFRKYGTPESIASRISAECSEPLYDGKGTLICDSFIMKRGDFETYIPFEHALHVFRREHRTNGIQDGVYLCVTDVYGEKQQYSFKMGRKGKAQMQEIVDHIMQQAPDCAAGYSREALTYVKQNTKEIPDEIQM